MAYFSFDSQSSSNELIDHVGKDKVVDALRWMLLIRHFEQRGESAYQEGKVGGFFHSYAGQEAIQTAAVQVFGQESWYSGFYRCHALALLLGGTPNELMAELYGKVTGNALGRGGSMHMYAKHLLGGFAIVGGQLPIGAGAAFSLKYLKKKESVSVCFLGEGAVAQGPFHETLNLASLWNLPAIFVIENNQWGMGTHVSRALSFPNKIAETLAPAYKMSGYTLNGMDYFNCYSGFEHIRQEVLSKGRPVLVECVCERFRGHSISDPALYRSKESLKELIKKDPILFLRSVLEKEGIVTQDAFKQMEKETTEKVVAAMKFAEESSWPSPVHLEEDVYAP